MLYYNIESDVAPPVKRLKSELSMSKSWDIHVPGGTDVAPYAVTVKSKVTDKLEDELREATLGFLKEPLPKPGGLCMTVRVSSRNFGLG